jgi:hypothetical protein
MSDIGKIIEDIKGIVAVLDPAGAKWAEETKQERERNVQVHPLFRDILTGITRRAA